VRACSFWSASAVGGSAATAFAARPRTKAYGAVSVLIRLNARRTGFHAVARTVFRPPPNVAAEFPQFPVAQDYEELRATLERAAAGLD
jgi:16S rRNA A1518/A1519 N6-dimethyltransferase RsmA/KsgA/DIM1 with predicted DNA glycosylase/AP lyase activity